jgi:ferredoxin
MKNLQNLQTGNKASMTIQINEQCVSCGACIEVCPMGVLLPRRECPRSKKPVVTDPSVCILCGQCIAVCPKDAITNSHLTLEDFPRIDALPKIEWDQFIAMTRQRRSIRHFSEKPVSLELIDRIVKESTRYAPTGHNRQTAEIRIIQGELLRKIRDEINAVILRLEKLLRPCHWISKYSELQWRQMRLWKRMIEIGLDPSTRGAPLLLLFLADDRVKESEIDAAILSYQTMLSAEILELKSCYLGALRNSLPFSRKLRKLLNLPPHRIVLCGLLLGYTHTTYRRLVPREPIKLNE